MGCELHQNAFGGRAPLAPAGGAIALPSRYYGVRREGDGKERVGNKEGGEWENGKGMETGRGGGTERGRGTGRGEKDGKGKEREGEGRRERALGKGTTHTTFLTNRTLVPSFTK